MIIYKQYNQQQLNDQYNNRLHVPDYATYFERWEKLSHESDRIYTLIKDIEYGDLPRERLDIFPSAKTNSKTLVYIHGGYWHLFDKKDFHFVVNGFHEYDVTTILINYPLAPFATLDEIVASCRKAILWIYQNIKKFNGNPEQIFIAGYSSGGHLASMLMEKEWVQRNDAVFIKGVCSLSGVFNLVPIQLSNFNAVLNISDATAMRNSAVKLEPAKTSSLLLFVGDDETNEFKAQSAELYNSWKDKNNHTTILQLPGINHFSIPETLIDKNSPVHIAMCKLMAI